MEKISKDPTNNDSKSSAKKGKKGFQKGKSGNPNGRPNGSQNMLTLMAQKLLNASAEKIVIASLNNAKAGDPAAQKFWLERIFPLARSKMLSITLPKFETAQDIIKGYDVLSQSLSRGEITVDELLQISNVLENHRKALETISITDEIEILKENEGIFT